MKQVAWTFLCGALCAIGVQAALQNEWTFESDPYGVALTSASNAVGTANFSGGATNFQSTVYTASATTNVLSSASNRVLLCVGSTSGSAWTNGAVLNAALTSSSTGTHYLRYDVAYDLSTNNNSGTVLGAYFTGAGGADDRAAGFVLGYDKDSSSLSNSAPARRPIARITGLVTNGSLTAIAEVNLNVSPATLKVWYSVNGSALANYTSPNASKDILLTAISNLCFHATGNFRPGGSTNYAAVDNIRMADSWADITAPLPDFSKDRKIEISRLTITTPKGTFTNPARSVGSAAGATNTVEIVIRSLGAPVSNVISSVSAAVNPEYFSITSNSPLFSAAREYPQEVTNTFSVVIRTNAQNDFSYEFNVGATAAGASAGVSTNFILTLGAQISYKANSITWVSGGIFSNKYEPGEILDVAVISENTGTDPVSNIVNSLSADPAYFTISNLTSRSYPVLAVGDVTSTTYRVTILDAVAHGAHQFSITNQAGAISWPASFSINVFKQGIPSVSPASITINLPIGRVTNNTEVVVTNAGNAPLTFSITDTNAWDVLYDVTTGTLGGSAFVAKYNNVITLKDPDTSNPYISSTNDGVSAATGIGFNFPFYGATYSNFYVTADGYVGLINTTNVPARSVDQNNKLLPATNVASQMLAPFWGSLSSPAGGILYNANSECLAISYAGISKDGVSNLAFQVALFTNGCVEFRYKTITGVTNTFGLANVTIGIQGGASSYTNLAVKPANGTSVRLTPRQARWVSYVPAQNVTVEPQSNQVVTFIANASGKAAGTSTTFNAQFNWSTGGSTNVVVSVNVSAVAPAYNAVSSLSFTGLAGQVTSAPFIINNTADTAPLTFTISDSTALAAGYITTNPPYSWIDISLIGTDVSLITPAPVNPYITAADEGFSAMIPFKFDFPFYGGNYTQFCVSANGALRLDATGRVFAAGSLASTASSIPAQMIAPYWGDLVLDANATIKYLSTAEQLVITWENVQQYGLGGGSNQTFQAILKPSGDITFQYKNLAGALSWPNTTIGLRATAARTKQMDIRLPGDRIVSTNQYGAVSTQYVSAVSSRAVQIRPANVHVIGYAPASGTIPAGSNAVITIIGDASNQSSGTNSISTNTTLTITHNAAGSPASLAVTFTVTNSFDFDGVFVRSAASALADGSSDSDGDGISDDQERIAGTDPQNADSVFSPVIGRDPSGASLSWPAPLDGVQRMYTVYFSTNLMGSWNYLSTVTNGTSYLDAAHSSAPVIYYKITVPVQ